MPAIASLEDLKAAQKEGVSIYAMLYAVYWLWLQERTPEKLKGEGNGNSSNQEKVRGLNNIPKVIGLVKDEDLTPKTVILYEPALPKVINAIF